ncbi:hypothetical protein D9611_006466 [Ephemerocybe angulata]|uniref:Uncharacterized protein n=1 Tax=Ephemerocybe angulata TaxID=980116 RepID=A0A8H5FHD0_9AGAR|nr:hypothetical protein D9611_006466 [Tulosesus angulatus]
MMGLSMQPTSAHVDADAAARVFEMKGLATDLEGIGDTFKRPSQSCYLASPDHFPQDVLRIILDVVISRLQESDFLTLRMHEDIQAMAKRRYLTYSVLLRKTPPSHFNYLGLVPASGPDTEAPPQGRQRTIRDHYSGHGIPQAQLPFALLRLSSVCAFWRLTCLSIPNLFSRLVVQLPLAPGKPSATFARKHHDFCRLFLTLLPALDTLSLVIYTGVNRTAFRMRIADPRTALARLVLACTEQRARWRELEALELDDRFVFQLLFGIEDADQDVLEPSESPFLRPVPEFKPIPPAIHLENLILQFDRVIPRTRAAGRREWCTIHEETLLDFMRQVPVAYPLLNHFQVEMYELGSEFVEPFLSAVADICRPSSTTGMAGTGTLGSEQEPEGKGTRSWGKDEEDYTCWYDDFIKDVRRRHPPIQTAHAASLWVKALKSGPVRERKSGQIRIPVVTWEVGREKAYIDSYNYNRAVCF